jgi:hypothetical protein
MFKIILLFFLILIILKIIQYFSPEIYDFFIVKMTTLWYKVVLEKVKEDSTIIDIGIGKIFK